MKTTAIIQRGLILLMMIISVSATQVSGSVMNHGRAAQDSIYKTFEGKVIDYDTKKPVIFANVYLIGSSLGVVTNTEGEFILKVPASDIDRKLGISNLGYKSLELSLSELKEDNNIIRLESAAVRIDEVVIRSNDPIELIKMALRRIRDNYKTDPEMQIGFYRETVRQNRNYVAVAEAVLDVYKASYGNVMDYDRVRIYKGRKSEDVKKMDTLMFKLQGGPRTSFMLDLVKNPGAIFSEDYIEDYNFTNGGFATIDGRDNYVIEFNQKENTEGALYKGRVFLDTKNLAFSRIEFTFSDKALAVAENELVRKKPIDLKVDVLGASYLINYRVLDDKWYLNYVRSELLFKCSWKKKRYDATYAAVLEMAVTDRTDNIFKAKYREQSKMTDIFADQVDQYKDENFWGEYNYIKPDESIESVIKKLSRRLKWDSIDEE
jgi:hypothetical protein